MANLFAAFKANENKKLMETPGIRERLGGVGNQFALTTILAFLISLPFLVAKEGAKFGEFVELFKTNGVVSSNLITSGLYFYLYNELATLTIKKTSATTQSVANTAKRVIVIVGSALAFGESLEAMKMLGCFICIGGVFAYSLVPRRSSNTPALSPTITTDPTPKRATCSRVRAPLWAGQVEAPRPSRAAPRGKRAARTGVILWGACSRRGVSAGKHAGTGNLEKTRALLEMTTDTGQIALRVFQGLSLCCVRVSCYIFC